jgi:hypothetical protein
MRDYPTDGCDAMPGGCHGHYVCAGCSDLVHVSQWTDDQGAELPAAEADRLTALLMGYPAAPMCAECRREASNAARSQGVRTRQRATSDYRRARKRRRRAAREARR